ncbi:MAG: hypothetical protein COU82_01650 [Candidatus Portnoybacteria bacterium CG10_big_fil_rev_8_21_14_0_10_38_18]|uniref:Uncharacterized protein n=1 Tax=Candidatus Portnoybacteria bacterium CG10_big_fil_rev_8_21_14_0_10_38_18 TaxID=1974813 RepID=A0A2M8KC81_9BACT|nr:MAG: hypothetical protein COU82_01650 [Candidatus Portnoybacteria bacterium CG10_big_fil_rev_8_21_14_0_10_38_18]
MEQNFDPNSQPNLQQTPSKFPTWAVVVLSVVVTALVVGLATYFLTKNNPQIANVTPTSTPIENQITPTNTPEPTANQPVVVKNDSYAYGSKILSYAKNPQLQYSDQYVTVYFSDGGAKTEIIHQVPIDIAGGGMPEFKKTSKPNIALLTTSFGDMGAFFSRYYYIDVLTKKVVQVNNTNGPTLEITDINNQVSKIQLSITDNCGQGENRREDMSATLKDITVNGKLQNVITQTRSLKCVNPGGIGDIYSPSPAIKFSGVSNDLSKLFFSLEGDSWTSGSNTVLWKNNFSFDLINKVIKEESPVNIL